MKTNIDDITIGDARKIAEIFGTSKPSSFAPVEGAYPYQIGSNYFIRTVTHHLTGKLVGVTDKELVISEAAWIADDGKLSDALAKETFNEVEMFPDRQVIVGRGSLIDAVTITKLPTSTK